MEVQMRLLRGVLGAAAVVVFVLAVTACGGYGGDDNGEEGGSTTIGGITASLHGTKDVSGETGKVEIEMYDDYFEPTVLKGEPGQTITLELKNEGEKPHTLTISDKGIDQEVQPGDEAEADVTFPQSGELVFVCRFHENNGMIGALEVSGSAGSRPTTTTTTTSSSDY
jgi:plastocyanin